MSRTIETTRDWRSHWADAVRRSAVGDLYAQVERTVGGKPVAPDQIRLVVEAVRSGLELDHGDFLLDLCCGNGLVTIELASHCRATVAVDYSEELIERARRHHGMEGVAYLHRPAGELAAADFPGERPNKICMNAGLQYFTAAMTAELLRSLLPVAAPRALLYFSDVPDADRLFDFYDTAERRAEFERRCAAGTEAIGTWWRRADLERIFAASGYRVDFVEQDPRRLTARYRYDLRARAAA